MTSMENEGSSTHTGGGPAKLGFENPGSHTQALTFTMPAVSVSECAGHSAQLAFARSSL
jgi:hypothetical protein